MSSRHSIGGHSRRRPALAGRATPGAVAVAALLLAAAVAAGQTATSGAPTEAGFGERIGVELVNVDVWVTDRQGEPITGLGVDDFEVRHDGKPVAIQHFSEVRDGLAIIRSVAPGEATAESEPTAATDSPAAAHVVVYFDRSRIHPSNMGALVRSLETLIDRDDLDPGSVLILSQDRALAIEATFGSSREELDVALARLARGDAAGVDLESEIELAQEAIRSAWEESQDTIASGIGGVSMIPGIANPTGEPGGGGGGSPRSVVGGVGSGGGPDACGMFVNRIQPTLDSWARSRAQRVAVTLSGLWDVTSFLAGLPGVKTLLYLSDGLDTEPGVALATYASSLCPGAGMELLGDSQAERLSDRFLDLTRHANSNRVTIHALQTTGLRPPGNVRTGSTGGTRGGGNQRSEGVFEARRRASEQDGLGLLAGQTGGRAVFETNDLSPDLARIARELGSYYSIAYEPPAGGPEAKSHRIDVEVGDGLEARYRRGYREKTPEEWFDERMQGALNLGITDNSLAVRLGAGTVEVSDDGISRVPLHVMIPVERLAFLPAGGGLVAQVEIEVLARDLGTGAMVEAGKQFRVKGAPGATGFADLPVVVELPAGTHMAAIGVRDLASREASFVSTTLATGGG